MSLLGSRRWTASFHRRDHTCDAIYAARRDARRCHAATLPLPLPHCTATTSIVLLQLRCGAQQQHRVTGSMRTGVPPGGSVVGPEGPEVLLPQGDGAPQDPIVTASPRAAPTPQTDDYPGLHKRSRQQGLSLSRFALSPFARSLVRHP